MLIFPSFVKPQKNVECSHFKTRKILYRPIRESLCTSNLLAVPNNALILASWRKKGWRREGRNWFIFESLIVGLLAWIQTFP